MLEGRGRFWKVDGKVYVYIPSKVASDSTFPLVEKRGSVRISIKGDTVVIKPLREGGNQRI